jgi:tellurite resistance protein TerC
MMSPSTLMWIGFGVLVIFMLAIDLKVFHRAAHEIRLKEALVWSFIWIAISLLFCAGIYHELGRPPAVQFLTGYLIEKSLSMDNLFVFLVIFRYFRIPNEHQHKILFWGILGALIFRAIFIALGVTLVQSLQWTIYILGAFLVVTGIRLAFEKEREIHPEKNLWIRLFRKMFPVTTEAHGDRFFVRIDRRLFATPLLITLIVIETTDIVFATDSIPAILGITTDPFLVYSSNILAILGLRALYFVLAGIMDLFRYLHYGLSVILVFIGAKMLSAGWIHLSVELELGIVFAILLLSILLSLAIPHRNDESAAGDETPRPS